MKSKFPATVKPYANVVAAPRHVFTADYEKYDGRELKRNPGIDPSRFRAYELPSLQGNKRVTPKHHN